MNPQPDKDTPSTFTQEMPDTTSSVPATIEGETVHTNPTPVESKPMIRRDENGRAIVDFSDRSKKTLAICTLIVSICGVLLGIVWPIAALAAIMGITFGIFGLVKNHGGKGMLIASIIISGFSLLVLVPFWFLFTTGFFQAFEAELDSQIQTELQRDYENTEDAEQESDVQSL